MSFFDHLPIRYRLLLGYMTVFLCVFSIVSIINYNIIHITVKKNIENELKNSTQNINNLVRAAIDASIRNHLRAIAERSLDITRWLYQRSQKGYISVQKAKTLAQGIFLAQKIGKTGYLYILDSTGTIRIHPKKKLLNVNISKHTFVKIQMRDKRGYIEYNWSNPGELKTRPKALYMLYFKPWDWIISATSYRDEFADIVNVDDFRKGILANRFSETGYSYVITSKGKLVIHPKLQGVNIYNRKDENGRAFIKQMCDTKKGKIIYPWRNPDEAKAREKLVYYNYISELDWIIASSGYLEEFYKPVNSIRLSTVFTIAFSILLIIPTTWFLSSRIAGSLNRLSMAFRTGSEGDYSVRIEEKGRGEIGQLAKYYNIFMEQLEWSSQKLQESEEKYRGIFENAIEGMFQTKPEGQFISANKALAELLGYKTPEDLITSVLDFEKQLYVNPNQRKKFINNIEKDGKVFHFKTKFLKKNYDTLNVAITARKVVDTSGKVHYEGSIRDLTAIKEKEKAERERKSAQSANKAKSQFLANMSHELRTPLNAILGYTQVFKKNKDLMKEHGKPIETIHSCGEHLLRMINDILDLSKIEANRFEIDNYEFALPILSKNIIDMTKLQAQKKGLEFIYSEPFNLPSKVLGDEKRISQVVLNLLSNAVNYTKQGEISLSVEVMKLKKKENKEYATIRFAVKDTGVGIDQNKLGEIFNPFYQIMKKGEMKKGTGLGLAISKHLVRLMGGELCVTSQVGEGSCFWFEVDVKIIDKTTGKVTNRISHLKGEGKKVFVVDDNIFNLKVMESLLSSMGFDVYTFESAENIIQESKKKGPALILMDLKMPEIDGFQALKNLQKEKETKDIAVIAVSASVDEKTRTKALNFGFDDYIAKPIHHSDLCKSIMENIDVKVEYESNILSQKNPIKEENIPLPNKETLHSLLEILKHHNITEIHRAIQKLKEDKKHHLFLEKLDTYLQTYNFKGAIGFINKCSTTT